MRAVQRNSHRKKRGARFDDGHATRAACRPCCGILSVERDPVTSALQNRQSEHRGIQRKSCFPGTGTVVSIHIPLAGGSHS